MSFDDGRYDGGHTELPGGWCIPNSQMLGWPFDRLITAPRTNLIPNPTPKGTHMPSTKNPRLRKLESELDGNLTLQKTLLEEEARLRADIRRADVPPEPPAQHTMFRVRVRFSTQGPDYTYLLIRTGSRWFTTGTSEEQKKFDSWFALCEWLNSTMDHSKLDVLGVDIDHAYATERSPEFGF